MNDSRLSGTPLVLVFVSELMMATRIENVVNKLGGRVKAAGDIDEFITVEEQSAGRQPAEPVFGREAKIIDHLTVLQPGLLIFDLADTNFPWQEWIALIKSLPATRRIPVICFGQHTDVDSIRTANKVGADLVVARSRFVSAMPDLLTQQIRTWDHEAIALSCRQPLTQAAIDGLIAFNEGDYFTAHEHLEDAWNDDDTAGRDVHKAVLQLAVAYLQIQRHNYRGAIKMFMRARQWLQPLPEVCRGIDIARLRADAEDIHTLIYELGPEGIDLFDLALLRPVAYTELPPR
jgi:hypothetical protein